MSARLILKEIGSRINNIGTIVDTDPNNDETTSYAGKMLQGAGAFGGGLKDIKDNFKFNSKDAADAASAAKDAADAASAAKDVAAAVSDKALKDVETNNNTTDEIFKQAYEKLDNIIFKYNNKGQALGEDDKLRAGVTAQSMQNSILGSNVFTDPESGFLKVDTAQLALSNAGAIKILFEKIDELEKLIKK